MKTSRRIVRHAAILFAWLSITAMRGSLGMAAPPETEAAPKAGIASTLASFVKANNNRNIDSVTACFSGDAVVYDDGQMMRGTQEIRQWIAGLFQKFRYVVTPTNVRGATNGAVLTATITGNFPGGHVSLDYHCRTSGDKIEVMVILPASVAK